MEKEDSKNLPEIPKIIFGSSDPQLSVQLEILIEKYLRDHKYSGKVDVDIYAVRPQQKLENAVLVCKIPHEHHLEQVQGGKLRCMVCGQVFPADCRGGVDIEKYASEIASRPSSF